MNINETVKICPSPRQLAWQQLEFYGFIHFGINTMTNQEWGQGHEDPQLFDPQQLDCDQWAQELKAAGMTGAILTCKHHDGFCLWQSRVTNHGVAASPYLNGKGDIVKQFSQACKKHGLKFGIYLSPWDRTEKSYGRGKAYDDFYVAQLTELLTGYGEIFEVWFDGANGEGAEGNIQQYDWERYYDVIRRFQPNAVIAICGPDVRWIGNEAGATRPNEWSVVPKELQEVEKVMAASQKADTGFLDRKITSDELDLGSERALTDYQGELAWYPAEVNTSIRPGWFYHPAEDAAVKSSEQLFKIYQAAVGGNAAFLLNVPPTAAGRLAEPDCLVLRKLGEQIRQLYRNNLLDKACATFSSNPPKDKRQLTCFDQLESNWSPAESDQNPSVLFEFAAAQKINKVLLQEDIRDSQRIEACQVWVKHQKAWQLVAETEAIGYKRVLEFSPVTATAIRFVFPKFRAKIRLSTLAAMLQ